MSPFSVIGATPTNSPLTVGDVINQLPAEVVRMGALPPEQPLSLPPALLENALRSPGPHLIEAVVPSAFSGLKLRLLPSLLGSLGKLPRPLARLIKRKVAP